MWWNFVRRPGPRLSSLARWRLGRDNGRGIVKVKDIPLGFQCKNAEGHVEWTARDWARPAQAKGYWRVRVTFDDGKPGNKFYPDGELEVGNGFG